MGRKEKKKKGRASGRGSRTAWCVQRKGVGDLIYIYTYIYRYVLKRIQVPLRRAFHTLSREQGLDSFLFGRGARMVWLRSVLILVQSSVVIRPYSQGLYTKENTKMAKEEIFPKKYFSARI